MNLKNYLNLKMLIYNNQWTLGLVTKTVSEYNEPIKLRRNLKMILDNIQNCKKYEGLNKNFQKAFDFLKREDLDSLALGNYEINGEEVFAMVQEYETKDLENAKYEAHKKYIDIQYMLRGAENMGYSSIDKLKISTPYNEEKDCMFLEGETKLIKIDTKDFFVLFPEDAHMPGMLINEKNKVKKVVVKVRL